MSADHSSSGPLPGLRQHLGNRAIRQLLEQRSVPSVVHDVLRSPGLPLDAGTRELMESRFHHDFSRVRVHSGAQADRSARALNAHAYTVGQDITFAGGQFQPTTPAGLKLLSHELMHTVQNARAGAPQNLLQRDEAPDSAITARSILPYDVGERVTVNHLVNDVMLGMIQRMNPDVGTMLGAMVERRAVVTIATDEVFEAQIQAEAATSDRPARGAMVLRLQKRGAEFDLEFFQVDADGNRTPLQPLAGLAARRAGGAITLSGEVEGIKLEFAVRPGAQKRQVTLGVSQPLELQLLDIRSLGTARAGSTEERRVVETAAKETGGARHFRRQRLSLDLPGGFWLGSDPVAPLFGVAWQMNFLPSARAGPLAQIPVEVQLQYVPSADFLARISSGFEASGSPLVPINVRLIAGVGAGTVHADPEATDPSRRLLLGPTFGGSLGYERGWFRMDVRYEYLLNLLEESPSAHTFGARLGGAF